MSLTAKLGTAAQLRSWLEAHAGEPVCDACVALPHDDHTCGRQLDLPPVEAKRFDKALYDLRHIHGLVIATERGVCSVHGKRSHYRLTTGRRTTRVRVGMTEKMRAAVRDAYRRRDAFTGATTERGEVDHRVPHTRTNGIESPVDFSDLDAVRRRYMWLSPEHNKLKNAQCKKCQLTNNRPAFFGLAWWFEGDADWTEAVGCNGCGWAYPERWRQAVSDHLASSATSVPYVTLQPSQQVRPG